MNCDELYGKYGFRYSYDTHKLVYSVTGNFYPDIVPEDMFRSEIEIFLNDYDTKHILSDKNYFDIFMNEVKFPETIVRNIDGVFYDNQYNLITKEQADEIAKEYHKVVYKPSIDNGFGRSVALLDVNETSPTEYGKENYVIQRVLKQHPALSALNESSVNVCRIVTVFVDNEVYAVTAALRIGGVGSFTDNAVSDDGKGMIIIGIDENGKLKQNGYYSCGLSTKCTPAGIEFLGYEVPKFKEMIEIAQAQHVRYPRIRFIAWDFTVDENNDVVCMEYNIKGPGVLYYQYVNGPLLGAYTEKILDFTKKIRDNRK